jgi:hypothetical protein
LDCLPGLDWIGPFSILFLDTTGLDSGTQAQAQGEGTIPRLVNWVNSVFPGGRPISGYKLDALAYGKFP